MSEVFSKKSNKIYQNANGDDVDENEEVWYKVVGRHVILHNEDGPARVRKSVDDGGNDVVYTEYRQNGELHREDGPAVIPVIGDKEYFYKGHSAEQLRLLAHAKGVTAQSWDDLVNFAKREQI